MTPITKARHDSEAMSPLQSYGMLPSHPHRTALDGLIHGSTTLRAGLRLLLDSLSSLLEYSELRLCFDCVDCSNGSLIQSHSKT